MFGRTSGVGVGAGVDDDGDDAPPPQPVARAANSADEPSSVAVVLVKALGAFVEGGESIQRIGGVSMAGFVYA